MIVSSIPRSGSTKYCSDLADKLGYQLLDEIFNINIEAKHKNEIHELKLDVVYPKTVEFLKTVDFNKVVVNNHDTTWFNLVHTDIFVSRQNVQNSMWSYLAFIEKMLCQFTDPNPRQVHNTQVAMLQREFVRAKFFYDFVIAYEKPVAIPELAYSDQTLYREKYSAFKPMIDHFGTVLKLPIGLTYK